MTSIAPIERGNVPKRAYITTAAYSADIYNYARTYNASTYTWSGALTSFSDAGTDMGDANDAGIILRETGRKLYPGANPDVSTYMVGVYHPDFGTGFIDPNSPKFAVYNSDKPLYIADGVDPATSLVDQGQPVYTRGTVTAVGNIATTSGSITAYGQIRSTNVTDLGTFTTTGNTATIDATNGQIFTVGTNGSGTISNTIQASNVQNGMVVYLQITFGANYANDTIVFGNNIRESASFTSASASTYMVTFVGIGSTLFEVSRTSALSSS